MTRAAPALSDITLAILAGGEGSRMGQPKGLLRIGDRAILEYLLDQFAWPGPTLLVTAPGREHPPGWERFGREWVDPVAGQGPLRGVLTALENTTTEWIAVVTVDMPGVGREQLEALARGVREGDAGIMYRHPSTAAQEGFLVEPFPLLVRKTAADLIRSRIATGALSVFGLRDEPGFAMHNALPSWGEAVWVNLNRPQDLESFEART
jgi:molybdenum cofactor guanylyltransferase